MTRIIPSRDYCICVLSVAECIKGGLEEFPSTDDTDRNIEIGDHHFHLNYNLLKKKVFSTFLVYY